MPNDKKRYWDQVPNNTYMVNLSWNTQARRHYYRFNKATGVLEWDCGELRQNSELQEGEAVAKPLEEFFFIQQWKPETLIPLATGGYKTLKGHRPNIKNGQLGWRAGCEGGVALTSSFQNDPENNGIPSHVGSNIPMYATDELRVNVVGTSFVKRTVFDPFAGGPVLGLQEAIESTSRTSGQAAEGSGGSSVMGLQIHLWDRGSTTKFPGGQWRMNIYAVNLRNGIREGGELLLMSMGNGAALPQGYWHIPRSSSTFSGSTKAERIRKAKDFRRNDRRYRWFNSITVWKKGSSGQWSGGGSGSDFSGSTDYRYIA